MLGVLAMVDKIGEPPHIAHQSKENVPRCPGIDLENGVRGFVQKLWSNEVSA